MRGAWAAMTRIFESALTQTENISLDEADAVRCPEVPVQRPQAAPSMIVFDFDDTLICASDDAGVARSIDELRSAITELCGSRHSGAPSDVHSRDLRTARSTVRKLFIDSDFALRFFNAVADSERPVYADPACSFPHDLRIASFSTRSRDRSAQPWLHSRSSDASPVSPSARPHDAEALPLWSSEVALMPRQCASRSQSSNRRHSSSTRAMLPPSLLASSASFCGLDAECLAPEADGSPRTELARSSSGDGPVIRCGPSLCRRYGVNLETLARTVAGCTASHRTVLPTGRGDLSSTSAAEDILDLLDGLLPHDRPYFKGTEDIVCWRSNTTFDKNRHLEALRRDAATRRNRDYHRGQIILIDNDAENVRAALADGFTAFHCPDGFTEQWYAEQADLHALLGVFPEDLTSFV